MKKKINSELVKQSDELREHNKFLRYFATATEKTLRKLNIHK